MKNKDIKDFQRIEGYSIVSTYSSQRWIWPAYIGPSLKTYFYDPGFNEFYLVKKGKPSGMIMLPTELAIKVMYGHPLPDITDGHNPESQE